MSETQFFHNLLPEVILSAVEQSGVRCTGRLLQLNSLENRVYEVELESKEDELQSRYDAFRVVKFYRPGRWSAEQILEEHRFLDELKEEGVSVVAAQTLPSGKSIATLAEQAIYFAVFPKEGGRLLDEFNEKQLEKVGRSVARLHMLGAREEFQNRLRLNADNFARESLRFVVENHLLPEIMANRYVEVVEQISDLADSRLKGVPYRRVHGDLHFGNVIWNDEEPTLVDFDDTVMGPVVQDIWLLAPGRDSESQACRQAILDGYQQLCHFDFEQLVLIEVLRSLRIIRFSGWIARRFSDPAFKRAFPDFGSLQYWRDQLFTLEEQLALITHSSSSSSQ